MGTKMRTYMRKQQVYVINLITKEKYFLCNIPEPKINILDCANNPVLPFI